jgi:hypothetical protein
MQTPQGTIDGSRGDDKLGEIDVGSDSPEPTITEEFRPGDRDGENRNVDQDDEDKYDEDKYDDREDSSEESFDEPGEKEIVDREEDEEAGEWDLFSDIELDKAEGFKILRWALAIFSFVFCLIFVPVYTVLGTIAYVTVGYARDHAMGNKVSSCGGGTGSIKTVLSKACKTTVPENSTENACSSFLDGLLSILRKRNIP